MLIGTLAIDGWAVTFGTARGAGSPLFAVPNVTAHPSTASVPTSCSMWYYNCLCALKDQPLYTFSSIKTR